MKFDPSSSDFSFQYQVNENCSSQPTIIYLNEEYYYPNGYNINVEPRDALLVRQNEVNYLEFMLRMENVKVGQQVRIDISAK